MAKQIDEDAFKEKMARIRTRYVKIVNDAKKQNLDVGAEKKEKMAKVHEDVQKLGVPLAAFKDAMTMMDHEAKALGKREDVVETENEERLQHFDRIVQAISPEVLPLFDAATRAEIKRNAKAAATPAEEPAPPTAEEGDGKVVQLKPTFEDESATA